MPDEIPIAAAELARFEPEQSSGRDELAQGRAAAADQRLAVGEQQVVEIEIDQPAKRVAEPGPDAGRVIAQQEPRHEGKPTAARAREPVAERDRATLGLDV